MNKLCKAAAYLGYSQLCQEPVSMEIEQSFVEHVSRHGLNFGTKEEYNFRLNLFAQKDAEITKINAEEANFTVGHNFMSTWTAFEYKKLMGYRGQQGEVRNIATLAESNEATVDWRSKGAVNAVKNQLQELEAAYPYTSGTGQSGSCKYDASKGKVGVASYKNVPANSVAQLKAAIALAPVSVTIEADQTVFQMYTGGVMDSKKCGTQLDHAVAAVGYGTESGQDYYIVRNSWGSTWGAAGYIKIAAVDGEGICGIQKESLYPAAKN